MKDMKIERMERIEEELNEKIEKVMPSDRFEVFNWKSLSFSKRNLFFVDNLVWSLGLAMVLISLFMAYLFRNFRMIIISLIPNLFHF